MRPRTTASLALAFSLLCFRSAAGATDPDLAALEQSLRAAEMSFAVSVLEKDFEKFGSHIDPDAIFMGGRALVGKKAILEVWKGYFGADSPVLEWHPEEVVVQAGGKLGISKGPYILRTQTTDGEEKTSSGSFSSVWELQDDGSWRVLFDSGCAPCPECESP